MDNIREGVEKVNQLLENQGAAAVQKFAKIKDTGRDIYGYQPQKVFCSMCDVFGPENWFHEIVSMEYTETQAIARIAVTLGNRVAEQFGEHRIMKGDKGSACKSAVTDGIQKALSLFGVGAKAYRGELKDVFNGKVSHVVTEGNPLLDAAKAILNKEAGRTWWKENLAEIKQLGQEARNELVQELEGKK